MSNCCRSSSCCGADPLVCPLCGAAGESIPLETVKSLVQANVPATGDFYVCMTPACNVIYFGYDTVFLQRDVVVPIAWKDGSSPKYVCYCNRVIENAIVRAVKEKGARTVSDVAKATGAMKNGKCVTNNPKGTCCHKDIERVIHWTLADK